MAPRKIRSVDVELLESEVSKPPPLRIVKRSKTFSDSMSSQDRHRGRDASSSSSVRSRGSPPAVDGPLTVRKKRQGLASVASVNLEYRQFDKENEHPLVTDFSPQTIEDLDTTPKALRRVSRTISAGNIARNDIQRRELALDQGPYSMRNSRHSVFPTPPRNQYTSSSPRPGRDTPPRIPERRASKSKNFILRALGRSSEDSKAIRPVRPKASKNTLVRRPSQSSGIASDRGSPRRKLSGDTLYSMELRDIDIAGAKRDYQVPGNITPSPYKAPLPPLPQPTLLLSPHIVVTPEVKSVQSTVCTFWVAIEIRGEIHAADARHDLHPCQRTCSSQVGWHSLQDLRRYGHMYAMSIDLHAGKGCCLLDVIGDLQVRKLQASETHLILAKFRLDNANDGPSPTKGAPEMLMADLETQLGDSITQYLTVLVTFKHSGFTRWENDHAVREGTYFHSTFHQTEARLAIKRHCPQSAWSPRTSHPFADAAENRVLNTLIERHLPIDTAIQALAIINKDRTSIPLNRFHTAASRYGHRSDIGIESTIAAQMNPAATTSTFQTPPPDRRYCQTVGEPFARLPQAHMFQVAEDDAIDESMDSMDENDPARKIWASMREVSRGGHARHPRKSVSADHYQKIDDGCSPSRLSSAQSADGIYREHSAESSDIDIELKRHKIKEVALRNKRSVGTETLRSIAPSVTRHAGRVKPGVVGLGLVPGTRWGWASPWW